MFDYTGYECKACGEKFAEDDDIVVCPECGTPYHRDCYKKQGTCINTELHEKHISWRAEAIAHSSTKCRNCGNPLGEEQLFCDKCGTPTEHYLKEHNLETDTTSSFNYQSTSNRYGDNNQNKATENMYPYMYNYSDPLCGFNPDEEYENGMTTKDIGDFVNTNTHFYLPKFKLMKQTKFKISINIPAMIFPEIYFANRKMPLIALLILIFKTAISFPSTAISLQSMLTDSAMNVMIMQMFPFITQTMVDSLAGANLTDGIFYSLSNLCGILNWVSIFIFASLSNYIYYRHVLKRGGSIKKLAQHTGAAPSDMLKISGGTSAALLVVFIALELIVQYAAMAAVFLVI